MEGRYVYRCWEDDSIIPDNLREGYSGFVIDMRLRHLLERPSGGVAVVAGTYEELLEYPMANHPTVEYLDVLIHAPLWTRTPVYIPVGVKKTVIDQVLSLAKSIWNHAGSERIDKLIPIAVELVVKTSQKPEESEEEAIAMAFSECTDDVLKKFYPGRYVYRFWQDDGIIPDNLPDGYSGLVIDMRLRHILERADSNDSMVLGSNGELLEYSMAEYPTLEFLHAMLFFGFARCSRVIIPDEVEEVLIAQVLRLAEPMWSEAQNKGIKKVMPIAVEVVVKALQEPNEGEQEAIARAFSECADDIIKCSYRKAFASDNNSPGAFEKVTAIKSSINALEYVRFEDLPSARTCELCFKKLSAGPVLGRMPCSHLYHAHCIIRQLVISNCCLECPPK